MPDPKPAKAPLRRRGIYALPDGMEYIVVPAAGGYHLYPRATNYLKTENVALTVHGSGWILNGGVPTGWTIDDLTDTGWTAYLPP